MKRPLSLILSALLLLGALPACSSGTPSDKATASNPTPALPDTSESSVSPPPPSDVPEDCTPAETGSSARSAYRALLEGVLDRCELP